MQRVTEVLQEVVLEDVLGDAGGADEACGDHIEVLLAIECDEVLLHARSLRMSCSTLHYLDVGERDWGGWNHSLCFALDNVHFSVLGMCQKVLR